MKKHTITLAIFILTLGGIQAQKTVVKTYLEKVHAGYKVGSAIGHETYNQIEFGAFYQKAAAGGNGESQALAVGTIGKFESEFTGIYVAIPIQDSDEVDFKIQVRTGITNRRIFTTTPSLLAHYKPVDQIRFGFGIGFRVLTPTIQSSFSISF